MNMYDIINSRILELLEKGVAPWRTPWANGMPKSFATKKEYRGINALLLSAATQYSQPWWLTYNQAKECGGYIKKGEKATPIIFWKLIDKEDGDKLPLLRHWNVWNVEQTEGVAYPELPSTTTMTMTPIEMAEGIITNMPNAPRMEHEGRRAFYNLKNDFVALPPKHLFDSMEDYYNTAFHELSHSTMHESRLNRKATAQWHSWGGAAYSKEELVAEMGASFLCGHANIVGTIENSAAYINGWLKALRNDKTLLVSAAAQAQRSTDYILGGP